MDPAAFTSIGVIRSPYTDILFGSAILVRA
jgi:hypothetical protein